MESRVKSHISNKTYIANLDTLEEEDKDLKSELYMIPISGRKIMVSPGKSRMDENGIAFCYVYVIQRERVLSKLGVYEKKSDSMPLIFDISTFPEGSFCLFEEFEKNPSKLIDFEMKDEKTVFDFLIEQFPNVEDKKKTLKSAYKIIYELLMKEENKKDKEMKPILKVISAASKEDTPTDSFLYTLKDNASDKTVFVYTLIALQYVFKIEFRLKTDNAKYQEILTRWSIQDYTSTVDVDVDTYEIIQSIEPLEMVKELDLDQSIPEEMAPDTKLDDSTPKPVDLDESIKTPNTKLDDSFPKEELKAPDTRLDESTPKPVDLDESLSKKVLEEIPEEEVIEPLALKKTRKTRTPKSDTKPSSPKEKTKAIKAKKTMDKPLGTSLNVETKITEPKIKAPRKLKLKSKEESS